MHIQDLPMVIIICSFLKNWYYLFSSEDCEDWRGALGTEEGGGAPRREEKREVGGGRTGPTEEEEEGIPQCSCRAGREGGGGGGGASKSPDLQCTCFYKHMSWLNW